MRCVWVWVVLCGCAAAAWAAEGGDDAVITARVDWLEELRKGGATAVALVALLMAGIAFIVERLLSLRRKYLAPMGLTEEVAPLWGERRFDAIVERCEARPSTLARVIAFLARHRDSDPGLLIPGAQDIVAREIRAHKNKAFSLAVVAALAPLLGLLGTMIGMIEAFKLVEVYGDEGGASMLAGSISKALITTAVGLIIAIPTLAVYHALLYRANQLGDTVEVELERLVNAWLIAPSAAPQPLKRPAVAKRPMPKPNPAPSQPQPTPAASEGG